MLMTVANALTGVLSNSAVAGIRTSRETEIDLTAGTDGLEAIRNLFDRSAAQMRMYKIDAARLLLLEASEAARKARCRFLQAASGAELALMGTHRSTNASILHFLGEAHEVLEQDIFSMQDRFMEMRTTADVAKPLLAPRQVLLKVIQGNIEQYTLLERSPNLREIKARADEALLQSNWELAENLCTVGVGNALKVFGKSHWWVASMRFRLGSALLGKKVPGPARLQVMHAELIMRRWAVEGDSGPFAIEMELLKIAAKSVEQPSKA